MFDLIAAVDKPVWFTVDNSELRDELAMLYMQGKIATHASVESITFTETAGKNIVAVMVPVLPEDKQA